MADIELVIKLPEEIVTDIRDYCGMSIADAKEALPIILNAIHNGTPLPEHHGRLGDLDALKEYFRNVRKELKASDYKSGIEFYVRDEMLLIFQQFIHLCDAIIEGSDEDGR